MNKTQIKKLDMLIEKDCTDDDIADFCNKNSIPQKDAFERAAEYNAPPCCIGCGNITFFPNMYPCSNCTRGRKDHYIGRKKDEPGRDFLSLTTDEIKEIVNEIFKPKKITSVKKSRKYDEITCTIYTEWRELDDDGKPVTDIIQDSLTLMNPFDYGERAIYVDFGLTADDYTKLKRFCYEKGIRGAEIAWLTNTHGQARGVV